MNRDFKVDEMSNIESNKTLNPNDIENPTKFVAMSATFTALVFIATAVFQLAITATNGYFNFGESMVYLSAIVGGPLVGLVAGAVGSALSDIITGYGIYAPGTFVIKGLEGYVAGYLFLKLRRLDRNQIKAVYAFFSALFVGLTIILTTPSLFNFLSGSISLGKFPTDIGSYQFSLFVVFYTPQFSSFSLANLQNLIVWNQTPFQLDIPGLAIILLTIIFTALIWFIYYKYGEKSKIIFSCAASGIIMVVGYLLYELIILGLTLPQVFSEVPFNILQVVIGVIIAVPTYQFLINSGIILNSEEVNVKKYKDNQTD